MYLNPFLVKGIAFINSVYESLNFLQIKKMFYLVQDNFNIIKLLKEICPFIDKKVE